jgi:hypothetical protein
MYTMKYRYYARSNTQPADASHTAYDEFEMIQGPFSYVSAEWDDGWRVVHAHRNDTEPGYTFGPVKDAAAGQPRPTLYVMNDHGATVAKYDL